MEQVSRIFMYTEPCTFSRLSNPRYAILVTINDRA